MPEKLEEKFVIKSYRTIALFGSTRQSSQWGCGAAADRFKRCCARSLQFAFGTFESTSARDRFEQRLQKRFAGDRVIKNTRGISRGVRHAGDDEVRPVLLQVLCFLARCER